MLVVAANLVVAAERVFHIGNFVPAVRDVPPEERTAWRERLGLGVDARMLFALGRFVEKKGFHDLLEAWAQVGPAAAPWVLVIAGDGPERAALAAQAERLGLGARLRWAGWQNDPAPLYEIAEAFVCPSRHEPLGNVILEAWTHRLPVLSTNNEGARELVTPGLDALLAPMGDPDGLAVALRELLTLDDSARGQLADAGHDTVRREHDEQAVVDAYLRLYAALREVR